MRFAGKVAIVTGAGTGIGRAIAEGLAREGAAIGIAERNPETGEAVASGIRAAGGEALALPTDVTDPTAVQRIVDAVATAWGGVDILVNNANKPFIGPLVESAVEQFEGGLAVDLRGIFLCARSAVPHMVRRGGGAIVNISSIMATHTQPGATAYTTAKAGVDGLTRALAVEFGPQRIRVNAVSPGCIDTERWERDLRLAADPEALAARITALHPIGRRGTPEDVAEAVLFLASDVAGFITGANLTVDGGLTVQFRIS